MRLPLWGEELLPGYLYPQHAGKFTLFYMRGCLPRHVHRVQLCATPWMGAQQAPLSMGFSRQEYWSGLPFPPPGDLPNAGIEPTSLKSPALAGRFFTPGTTREAQATKNTLLPPKIAQPRCCMFSTLLFL